MHTTIQSSTRISFMNILIIGNCGTGKTYIMTELIKHFNCNQKEKLGLVNYNTNKDINIIGNYDGSIFQGSDKLSMSVMTDVSTFLQNVKGINIFEGDRFTNSKFITKANPFIFKINGNGKEGRELRSSQQTTRQIKSIATRVNNINTDAEIPNSKTLLIILINALEKETKTELELIKNIYKPKQTQLF